MRLYVHTRVATGTMIVRAHLCEMGTNRVVWTCPHKHRSRLHNGGKNGTFYAIACGEHELRRRDRQSNVEHPK